jgi:hypothetical protein
MRSATICARPSQMENCVSRDKSSNKSRKRLSFPLLNHLHRTSSMLGKTLYISRFSRCSFSPETFSFFPSFHQQPIEPAALKRHFVKFVSHCLSCLTKNFEKNRGLDTADNLFLNLSFYGQSKSNKILRSTSSQSTTMHDCSAFHRTITFDAINQFKNLCCFQFSVKSSINL